MKKLFIVFTLLLSIANAGVWEKLQSFGDETVESNSYDVEAKGWNFRAYEFVPQNDPTKLCVIVTSDKNNMQMECFTKGK